MSADLSEEEIKIILAQAKDSALDRELARPENAVIKKEWEEILTLRRQIDEAMILAFTSTSYPEVRDAGLFVSANFAHLAHRTFAIRPLIDRLYMIGGFPGIIAREGGPG